MKKLFGLIGAEPKKIDIEIKNQPFQLSGLLRLITNKVSEVLKKQRHLLYYDIKNDIGRYVIGDNHHIGTVLEILLGYICVLSKDSEIIVTLSKSSSETLVFEIINKDGHAKKHSKVLDKALQIAQAMDGDIRFKSSRFFGTKYIFCIPFIEDENNRSNQGEIKKVMNGKEALYLAKSSYDIQRAKYIFDTYGVKIDPMNIETFEKKKPNLQKYDMVFLRSDDLTPKHISFFKSIYQDKNNTLKIIIIHEIFESKVKMDLSRTIADAELYNPTVIGDVEEILYKVFISKTQIVDKIEQKQQFHVEAFKIHESDFVNKESIKLYRGSHIVVVEENRINQEELENILDVEGLRVTRVNNGLEMLDLLDKEEVDFIFTDIMMPVLDGINMTKRIRNNPKYKQIPIVSISSMAFEHEIKEMSDAGINACITKPYTDKQIYTALDKFLVVKPEAFVKEVQAESYDAKKDILDVEAGIQNKGSELLYGEFIIESMESLEGSVKKIEQLIYANNIVELRGYVEQITEIYEKMHTPAMSKMFNEFSQFLATQKDAYPREYITMYRRNWIKLNAEIDRYLTYLEDK